MSDSFSPLKRDRIANGRLKNSTCSRLRKFRVSSSTVWLVNPEYLKFFQQLHDGLPEMTILKVFLGQIRYDLFQDMREQQEQ
ncbi:hypothetical protein [Paraburkholderia antibiotica]|uniref:Uncharacterized protein n=1 Tax=Paraburkholderia antibiotica TaxID=2728839 RepID=A0A7X9X7D6_9BURK|nr:hypothetical protein [Paraburkholderia antibiotica]NML32322.1 hypothetical protein [Paraburkholderia antibiotica]